MKFENIMKKLVLASCCVTGMLMASETIIPVKGAKNLTMIDCGKCIKVVNQQRKGHTTTIYSSFQVPVQSAQYKISKPSSKRRSGTVIKIKSDDTNGWVTYPVKKSDDRFLARLTVYGNQDLG